MFNAVTVFFVCCACDFHHNHSVFGIVLTTCHDCGRIRWCVSWYPHWCNRKYTTCHL